jgi:hypothetical protein
MHASWRIISAKTDMETKISAMARRIEISSYLRGGDNVSADDI